MQIKEGASLQGLNIKMKSALVEADRVWKEYGQDLVVTSGTDGEHSAGSLHYYGYALDLRTKYFPPGVVHDVAMDLTESLGRISARFQVFVHTTHIHVEYDINVITQF